MGRQRPLKQKGRHRRRGLDPPLKHHFKPAGLSQPGRMKTWGGVRGAGGGHTEAQLWMGCKS